MTQSGTLAFCTNYVNVSHSGPFAQWSCCYGITWGRCQLLAQAGEWTSTGLCYGPNTLQLVYQRPPRHTQLQVSLCSHLLCLPSGNFFLDRMHFNRWPCSSCSYYQQWRLKPSTSKTVTSVSTYITSDHVVNWMFRWTVNDWGVTHTQFILVSL